MERIKKGVFSISEDDSKFVFPSKLSDYPVRTVDDKIILDIFESTLKTIGYFSVDDEKNVLHDRSSLNFIDRSRIPEESEPIKVVDLDLTIGEDINVPYTGSPRASLENILKWIMKNEELVKTEFSVSKDSELNILGPDFVCSKTNTLFTLFNLPYVKWNLGQIQLCASCLNGTVYLFQNDERIDNVSQTQASKWAFNFKQFMYGEDTGEPVIENKDFRLMVKAFIGPFLILYSSTTDGVDPDKYDETDINDTSAFIKLKTLNMSLFNNKDFFNKTQAFPLYMKILLSATQKAIIGFRDDSTLTRLELFTQEKLKEICKKERRNPLFGFIFASRLLTFIQHRAQSEPGAVFSFTKKSGDSFITCRKEEDFGPIVPDWFEKRHSDQNGGIQKPTFISFD